MPQRDDAGRLSGDAPTRGFAASARTFVGIYLLFLAVYLMTCAGHFFSTDHVAVYLTAEGIVERGDLAIKPINDAVPGRDGKHYAAFGLGQPLVVIPLYIVGRFVEDTSSPSLKAYFGGAQLGDWGGTVPIFFVSLTNQLLTPLTCVLVFLFARRLEFSWRTALITTSTFGFATATWVYARDSFQHPLETLMLLLAIYVLFANRERLGRRHAVMAGAALAMGVLTRINMLAVVPLVAIYLTWIRACRPLETASSRRRQWLDREAIVSLALFAAPIAIVLVAIMALNYGRFGQFLNFHGPGQAKGFSTPIWVGLYGNLLSVGRSLWLYSPPLILVFFAFTSFYRKYRAEALLFVAIAVVYLAVYSTYGFWDGGWAYGPRFLLPVVPLLTLPVGFLLDDRRKRALVALLVALGIGVQILGVTINYDFVYWDWIRMNLSPPDAFLFVPHLSAVPTHLQNLLNGRHIDLWLLEVYKQFGTAVFLLTLAVPLGILACGVALLRAERAAACEQGAHVPLVPIS
jgi:hypothetical protein